MILPFGLAVLLPAVLCAVIARNEGRNTLRWTIYGLFLGVFAIIYLVFYAKSSETDKIPFRILLLGGIMLALLLVGLYQTLNGNLVSVR